MAKARARVRKVLNESPLGALVGEGAQLFAQNAPPIPATELQPMIEAASALGQEIANEVAEQIADQLIERLTPVVEQLIESLPPVVDQLSDQVAAKIAEALAAQLAGQTAVITLQQGASKAASTKRRK